VAIVLAADSLSRAAGSTSTNDSDGATSETDKDVQVLKNDAKKTKESSGARRGSRFDSVAALNGSRGATASRLTTRSWCGDRKSSESGGDKGKFELHVS
jgi:hypothetical protein